MVLVPNIRRAAMVVAVPTVHGFALVMFTTGLCPLAFAMLTLPACAVVIAHALMLNYALAVFVTITVVVLGRGGRRYQADRQS